MGRPKKSDLKCTVCSATFMLKRRLLIHMKSHSGVGKKKESIASSNWCHGCRKSFKDSEYKLHIQTEHQCGLPNLGTDISGDDGLSFENKNVLLSTKKIKKEVDEHSEESSIEKVSDFQTIISDIKIEPNEISSDEEYNEVPKKMPLYKCPECGLRCKGQRGLKNHVRMAHRLKRKYFSDTSQSDSKSELEVNEQQEQSQIKSPPKCGDHPILLSNNGHGLINLNFNSQPGLFSGAFPLNNALTIGNQTNAELSSASCNENIKILEVIPKFEYSSESYMKWLKKFIRKCKTQKYPLPQVMCENINHVLAEISHAAGNPVGPLRKKSDHYFVVRLYKILSEVMMGHMRHSLCVVIR